MPHCSLLYTSVYTGQTWLLKHRETIIIEFKSKLTCDVFRILRIRRFWDLTKKCKIHASGTVGGVLITGKLLVFYRKPWKMLLFDSQISTTLAYYNCIKLCHDCQELTCLFKSYHVILRKQIFFKVFLAS